MRILITGSTGFIGSDLVSRLEEEGYEVHQLVRYRAGRWDGYIPGNLNFADLRDEDSIASVFSRVKPQVVIHLAAMSAVSFSFINPNEVTQVNFLGTINLFKEAFRYGGLQHFIHASTSEVYGAQDHFPTREDAPLQGLSPYAVSKIAAEEFLRMQIRMNDAPITILRPFNTFGRALVDNRHFVVERAIVGALTEGTINLHDATPRRDFMWREDHVRGYVHAVKVAPLGETINLCTGNAWTIKEMAEEVAKIVHEETDREVEVNFSHSSDRPLDMPCLHGSREKAFEVMAWVPHVGFEEGLRKAVREWRERLNV